MLPVTSDPVEVLLNRTWRPTLSVVGVDGFPELKNAGNVLRPKTTLKLSMRIPPSVEGSTARIAMPSPWLAWSVAHIASAQARASSSGVIAWGVIAPGRR